MTDRQAVDPYVSRAKFAREVEQYRALEAVYRRQGWLMLDAAFPEVFVAFVATKPKPAPLVAGVVIDFTDYDLRPPSVRFVDPLTREVIKSKDLGFRMARQLPGPSHNVVFIPGVGPQLVPATQDLIQANGPDEVPFLCLPGVREYHDNPAHTGDSWLLHRASGEGSLAVNRRGVPTPIIVANR